MNHLMEQMPFTKVYVYNPSVVSTDDPNKDFKILTYGTSRNQDLIGKLERGAYSSVRYYINPVSFKPSISVFNSKDYVGKVNTLGDKPFPCQKLMMMMIKLWVTCKYIRCYVGCWHSRKRFK